MRKINITKDQVFNVAKIGGGTVLLSLAAISMQRFDRVATIPVMIYSGYDNAVEAITDSWMIGADKVSAIKLLKRGRYSKYYSSVISVINSNMIGSHKIEAIRSLSEEESEKD